MKNLTKVMGVLFLSIATLIVAVGPTSVSGYAIEKLPESIKDRR